MNKQEQLVQTKEQHEATKENKQAATAAAQAKPGTKSLHSTAEIGSIAEPGVTAEAGSIAKPGSTVEPGSIAQTGLIIDPAEQQEGHADEQSPLSEQTPPTPPATGSGEWKELYKAIATYAKEIQKARL